MEKYLGVILRDENGRILLMKGKLGYDASKWRLPVMREARDRSSETLIKDEMQREFGYSAKIETKMGAWKEVDNIFITWYLLTASSVGGDRNSEYQRWFSKDELKNSDLSDRTRNNLKRLGFLI